MQIQRGYHEERVLCAFTWSDILFQRQIQYAETFLHTLAIQHRAATGQCHTTKTSSPPSYLPHCSSWPCLHAKSVLPWPPLHPVEDAWRWFRWCWPDWTWPRIGCRTSAASWTTRHTRYKLTHVSGIAFTFSYRYAPDTVLKTPLFTSQKSLHHCKQTSWEKFVRSVLSPVGDVCLKPVVSPVHLQGLCSHHEKETKTANVGFAAKKTPSPQAQNLTGFHWNRR